MLRLTRLSWSFARYRNAGGPLQAPVDETLVHRVPARLYESCAGRTRNGARIVRKIDRSIRGGASGCAKHCREKEPALWILRISKGASRFRKTSRRLSS